MNIRDKFRKRWLGQRGYAGGDQTLVNQPIIRSSQDRVENNQTQQKGLRNKPYKPGVRSPRAMRAKG